MPGVHAAFSFSINVHVQKIGAQSFFEKVLRKF